MSTSAASGFDALEYLIETLPAQLRMGNIPPPSEAVLQFLVTDARGSEVWYRLRNDSVEVNTGVHDRPDLTLVIPTRDLEALSVDTLDVEEALGSGRLKIHGNKALLGWVADRLQPSEKH